MLIPSVQRTINTSPGVTIISVETVIRTMAALISRSLSATLKDRESPAGRLCPLRRVSLFREEKVVVKEGRLHGMRLLHRPRGIDPPFDTAHPWLCTPLSQISLDTRATRASFEGPFLHPLPSRRPRIEDYLGEGRVLLSLPDSFSRRNSGAIVEEFRLDSNSGVWFEFKLEPRVKNMYSRVECVFFIGTRGFDCICNV